MSGRTLVAGWFSFPRRGATAGDLLARDVVCRWLADAGIPYDVANARPFPGGVDWRTVDARRYRYVVFVCGPFWTGERFARVVPRAVVDALVALDRRTDGLALRVADRRLLDVFVKRFATAALIGVNLSVLGPARAWTPFTLLVERDGADASRPDLSFLGLPGRVPVVGVCRVDAQGEYRGGRHATAHAAIDRLLRTEPAARVEIDTRLDIPNRGRLRSPAEIVSLIARMDVVVTTRLHGLVFALSQGVPAVAIDPIAGGAKITRQAQAVGWPAALRADELTDADLAQVYAYCLTEEARAAAAESARRAAAGLGGVRERLLGALR